MGIRKNLASPHLTYYCEGGNSITIELSLPVFDG
jgi:hypothetical protein